MASIENYPGILAKKQLFKDNYIIMISVNLAKVKLGASFMLKYIVFPMDF
jgi:hypothetical protein